MKHSLGKIGIILLLVLSLHAEDFTVKMHADTLSPYVKEPVLLSVDFNQTNPKPILLFQFSIVPNTDYRIHQIYARHDDTLHHAHQHNLYEIYPLRSGDINITFKLIKRVTNDDKVRYYSSGDRDDFKKLETTDYPISLAPLKLHVKPLPKGTQLVGNFKLDVSLKQKKADAYAPIPLKVTISGNGYPPVLPHIITPDKSFTLFSEKPIAHIRHSQDGTHNTVIYPMAISAAHSFTLPETTLQAFNPKTERSYKLTIPAEPITITPVDKSTLVDKVDNPKPLTVNWQWLYPLLGYLSAFIAGFATAWLMKQRRKKTRMQTHPLKAKIDACADEKALLALLMAQGDKRFESVIGKLEASLYGDQNQTLKQLKQEAKEQLS